MTESVSVKALKITLTFNPNFHGIVFYNKRLKDIGSYIRLNDDDTLHIEIDFLGEENYQGLQQSHGEGLITFFDGLYGCYHCFIIQQVLSFMDIYETESPSFGEYLS